MRQSYNLDALVDYGTDIVPDATMVVNPAYFAGRSNTTNCWR
jgi:hypothetical protein